MVTAADFHNPVLQQQIAEYLTKKIKAPTPEALLPYIDCPFKPNTGKGGIQKEIERNLTTKKRNHLATLSWQHREKVRIELHAVVLSAYLFIKNSEGKLSDPEKKALFQGIAIQQNGEIDHILTVRNQGTKLTENFKSMMSQCFQMLKPTGTCNEIEILKKAAALQTQLESKEITKKTTGVEIH
jgi:hypothetical protein